MTCRRASGSDRSSSLVTYTGCRSSSVSRIAAFCVTNSHFGRLRSCVRGRGCGSGKSDGCNFGCSLTPGRLPLVNSSFQVSYVVKDATGQALARVYARETRFRTARSGLKTAMCFWNRYSLVRA